MAIALGPIELFWISPEPAKKGCMFSLVRHDTPMFLVILAMSERICQAARDWELGPIYIGWLPFIGHMAVIKLYKVL